MLCKVKLRRRGADTSENESGKTSGLVGFATDESRRSVNSGNGTCIVPKTFSNDQLSRFKLTRHTRLLCSSAAMTLSERDDSILPLTMRGKAGQTSSLSFAGVLGVQ